MEYLMTYGWAILIISVVLGTLYQIGVFNSSSLSVRAPPGACQILRTSAAVNLVGQCSGILPQYVAQFDGQSSYVSTGTTSLPLGNNPRSVVAWVYLTVGTGGNYEIQSYGTKATSQCSGLQLVLNNVLFFGGYSNNFQSALILTPNQWHLVGYTYSAGASNTITLYLDGQSQSGSLSSALSTILPGSDPADVGKWSGGGIPQYFPGSISNVQIYNTSLSSSQVQALYQEGIGGAPVAPSNIVGWWPLNGDTKDYSGNNNNGAPTAITFVSQYGK